MKIQKQSRVGKRFSNRKDQERKRCLLRSSRTTRSNSPFFIELKWNGGHLKANIDSGPDSWVDPVALVFDSLVTGKIGGVNEKVS